MKERKDHGGRIINLRDEKLQFPVAIVVSRFNEEFTAPLLDGTIERLHELDFNDSQITVVWVPGAVEIPVVCNRLAKSGQYEAIISLGVVIHGETDHYDYVCEMVSTGCQRVAIKNEIPVIFGVLTCLDEAQVRARLGGAHGHKGRYCADAAVEMVGVMRQIAK
jgi:6,7-dimethyl-8-ribityllumazine synthase